jgi:hypothetical protein
VFDVCDDFVISVIYLLFVWIEHKKQIKRDILVTLPSVTLDKEVLCRVSRPAKKTHLGISKTSLPSVVALTLGKGTDKGSIGAPFAES